MNRDIKRLLLDYPRRMSWGGAIVGIAMAVVWSLPLIQAANHGHADFHIDGAGGVAFLIGWCLFAVFKTSHQQHWARAVATLPIARRDLGRAQWLVVFGFPIFITIAACMTFVGPSFENISRLGARSFGPWTLLPFLPLAGFASLLLEGLALNHRVAMRQSTRSIASGSFLILICWGLGEMVMGWPSEPYWSLAAIAMLIFVAVYTWFRPELLWTAERISLTPAGGKRPEELWTPEQFGRIERAENSRAQRSSATGWWVQWVWIFKSSLFALAAVALLNQLSTTSSVNSSVPLYLMFAFMSVPLQPVRILRCLPVSLEKLTAQILLTAFIPTAIFLTMMAGVTMAGLMTLSLSAILILMALPPALAASTMRFGGPLGCALVCLPALILRDLWLPVLVPGGALVAVGGILWLRHQLLVGREHKPILVRWNSVR